ncbi:DHC1 [Symbiodinium natans]|uniref:DHC1 protein n=1 Tax=Symbiodinium natans TaxID=878477 RepID=A0A812IC23_9DINO|nr:DHC1 [Symbiodinium natans]
MPVPADPASTHGTPRGLPLPVHETPAFLSEKQLHNIVKTQFQKSSEAALADPLVWGDFRDALDILVKSDTPYSAPRVYEDPIRGTEFLGGVFRHLAVEYGESTPIDSAAIKDCDPAAHNLTESQAYDWACPIHCAGGTYFAEAAKSCLCECLGEDPATFLGLALVVLSVRVSDADEDFHATCQLA